MPVFYVPSTCAECGSDFDQPQRRDANPFCSERCRVQAVREPYVPRPPRELVCGWCDAPFVQAGSGTTRVCCPSCGGRSFNLWARGRSRAIAAGVPFEKFNAHEVFQRDEWTCAICLTAIDRHLRHPDPLSPSLDHRVPLTRGGAHTLENCQAAHHVCNLRKGGRTHDEIAHLIPLELVVA